MWNRATQETFWKARFVIFRSQKYVKKGYIEITKKIYLEPLKNVLGHSVSHYYHQKPKNFYLEKDSICFCYTIGHIRVAHHFIHALWWPLESKGQIYSMGKETKHLLLFLVKMFKVLLIFFITNNFITNPHTAWNNCLKKQKMFQKGTKAVLDIYHNHY